MLRLEDEIIVLLRSKQRDDLHARGNLRAAMLDLPAEIRPPPAEVVVHVNHRHAGFSRAFFQPQQLPRHRPRVAQKLVRFREIEVVNDVDKKKRDLRLIRSAAVKVLDSSAALDILRR